MSITGKTPNAEKGKRYLAQLDQALCNGSWSEVPELARKTDKHAPERGCFTLTARTEAQIASASHRPTSASSTGTSSIHGLGEAVPRLQEAVANSKTTSEDAFCATACLAEIHWLHGDPSAVLRLVASNNTPSISKTGQSAPLGWLEVCEAKLAFLRAAALETTGQDDEVQALYRAAAAHTPGSRTPELRRWTERLLARACAFSYQRTHPSITPLSEALASFRAWSNFWQRAPPLTAGSGTGSTRIDTPRRQVWRQYYELLSIILRHQLMYTPKGLQSNELLILPTGSIPDEAYVETKSRQRAELKQVESTYESLLLNETQFPKSSQSNTEVEEWVEQAVGNWRILCGGNWTDEELGEGGKVALGRGTLDVLYRAATKTFHSTAILRQLFTVHAALGEFDLAMHAMKSYVEIVGKGKARAEKTGKHELGFDGDDTAIVTAAEAVHVLCKYGDREQAEKAVALGRTIGQWLGEQRPASEAEREASDDNKAEQAHPAYHPTESDLQPQTLAAAYRAIGSSQAHWSRLTYETDARAGFQQEATSNLQRALSYYPLNVETAYALALVLAETQNVAAAIEVVKRSVAGSQEEDEGFANDFSRQRQLVPVWHLLALCLTARHDYEPAARMCTAAFEQFGDAEVLFGQDGSLHPADPSKRTRTQRGIVDQMDDFEKEALLQVKMSQLTLVELTEGPEKAVDVSDELLKLYARLFGSPEQLKAPSKPHPTASTMLPPSRAGGGGTLRSVVGSIRPKSARSSVDKDTLRQLSGSNPNQPGTSAGRQTAPNGQGLGPPISITVTNEDGVSAEKDHRHSHHLHLPFRVRGHHGDFREAGSLRSKQSLDQLNEKEAELPARSTPAPPVPPKNTDVTDHANSAANPSAVMPAVEHSMSHETPANPQQPLKEVEHNRSPTEWPAPAGHEDEPLEQDLRLPAPHPASNSMPLAHVGSLHERQHKTSILVKVWLFIAGLYVRAGFYDDATGAIEEAWKLVVAFEAQKGADNANALALFQKGWGGGRSVDELWADVLSAKGELASAQELPFRAMEHYESALAYYPDHPQAIIGISDLLMDIYEEKMPAEEPQPLLPRMPTSSGSLLTTPSTTANSTTARPQTTAKSSLASAGRAPPPNARDKDPTPAELNRLACRDRAYMLLSSLTKLGTGWDDSEAWYTLARAYELSKQVSKAKQALWWVVELEDSRPMRRWSVVAPGGYAL